MPTFNVLWKKLENYKFKLLQINFELVPEKQNHRYPSLNLILRINIEDNVL